MCALWEQGGTLATPTRPFHGPLDLTPRITALDRFPAIILFLAFGQRDLNLGLSPRTEVNAERYDREPLLLRLAQQLADFFAMEEQLAWAQRIVVHDIAVAIRRDMAIVQNHLLMIHAGITITQVDLAFAQRFDLRTPKHDAGLHLLFDGIIVERFSVGRYDGFCLFLTHSVRMIA